MKNTKDHYIKGCDPLMRKQRISSDNMAPLDQREHSVMQISRFSTIDAQST